ncbi:ERF family protein [bacterium]|nr:ERF family protein [bacterium]
MSDTYRSEEVNEIVAALSKFQGSVPTIEKNKKVNFQTRNGKLSYNYADIADVMKVIRKPLSDNGLFVSHSIQITKEGRDIVTTVFHESGQWLKSSIILEHTADEKSLGGKITYYRRYSLGSLLGLVTDDDVDCDLQGCEPVQAKAIQSPPPEKVKTTSMTDEMKVFCKENEKTPYFKEFIAFISEKTNNSDLEIIRQAQERKETFLQSVKAYGQGLEKKKASAKVGQQKPQETKELAQSTN